MDKKDKIEERKRYNAPFLKAFDYLAKEKNMTAGELAKLIQTNGSYISACRSGLKRAGVDMQQRLAIAYEGRLYTKFLTGESPYMFVENVPDDEIIDQMNRESNPDYDAMKAQRAQEKQTGIGIDYSSLMNATIAAQMKTIESLESQIAEKDSHISDLRTQLKEKDELISFLKKKINQFEISGHPFPISIAEPKKRAEL